MSGNHKWTAQDDEDLLHLADSGYRIESVAWALDRSPLAVRTRLAQLRRPPVPAGFDVTSLTADAQG